MNKTLFSALFFILFQSVVEYINAQDLNKGFEYYNAGEYQRAANEFENSLATLKTQYGETDTTYYSKIVLYTALSYHNASKIEKAIEYYLQTKSIYNSAGNSSKNSWYVLVLNGLANLYSAQNDFRKAEPLFDETITVYKNIYGAESLFYAKFCKETADLFEDNAIYQKAEQLYLEVLRIYEKKLGKLHNDYADCVNNLAVLYYSTGDYEKAEAYYLEAKEINLKLYGKDHPSYGVSCNNLGVLYQEMGKYRKAMALYLVDKEITEKTSGKASPEYASTCSNLAALYDIVGEYKQAEELYLEAKAIEEKTLGTEHLDYATTCNNLANLYISLRKYKKAEPLYLEAREIRKKVLGVMHPSYASSCDNLGGLYQSLGKFSEAKQLFLEAKDIREQIFGKKNPDYAISCNSLASLYEDLGDYKKAEALYVEAKTIREAVLGKNHLLYATSCSDLGNIYRTTSEFQKAEPLLLEAKKIIKKVLGDKHPLYAENCNNLAILYHDMADYEKAKELYIEAKDIKQEVYGDKNISYGIACSNLATLYKDIGKYEQAEELFKTAQNICLEVYGKEHPNYASTCNSLAELYRITGNFSKAEQLYFEAKKIQENLIGKKHPDYATTCNNIALLYAAMGNYPKALEYHEVAKMIQEEVLGKEHPDYSNTCNNLGLLCFKYGFYDYAELFYKEAKAIRKKVLGVEHVSYAISCNNLALLYHQKGEYERADSMYQEAKSIYEKAVGKNDRNYATCADNLGLVYKSMGDAEKNIKDKIEIYKKAEKYALEAKEIREILFGKTHPNYALSCDNLALIYEAMGDVISNKEEKDKAYEKAEQLYLESNSITNFLSAQSARFLTENERARYLYSGLIFNYEKYHMYFLSKRKENKKLAGFIYNNALTVKGQLLRSAITMRKAVLQSGDTSLINRYEKMNAFGKLLAKQYILPKSKRSYDINLLSEKVNALEKEVTIASSKTNNYQQLTSSIPGWQDIQKSLKKDEAAIEFIQFSDLSSSDSVFNTYYFALVLTKSVEYPRAVYLFNEKQMQKLLERNENESDYGFVGRLYSHSSPQSDSLYRFVFKPVEKALNGIKTVNISPTGILNQIAFDALICDTARVVSDKYNIVYYSSTAMILNESGLNKQDISSTALFGGIEYSLSIEEMTKLANNYKTRRVELFGANGLANLRSLDTLTRQVTWQYLPGSLEETEEIENILVKNGVKVNLYKKEQGTEEQFKELELDAPSILHVSTHGFYFGDDKKSEEYKSMIDDKVKFAHAYDPLLRSGFVLAGGNSAFQGKKLPDDVEDGVLTALEISRLNFFNSKLAVLSACQTGLGDVIGSEGVYGLQRSFKMAGVDYLLFSLWEVPDYQTRQLMTNFYQNWFSGMEIRKAFKAAQEYMKKVYAESEDAAFAWARLC
jgi:tetratricopeptide (TPR) repeat protein/CHAT domain-containing protein